MKNTNPERKRVLREINREAGLADELPSSEGTAWYDVVEGMHETSSNHSSTKVWRADQTQGLVSKVISIKARYRSRHHHHMEDKKICCQTRSKVAQRRGRALG